MSINSKPYDFYVLCFPHTTTNSTAEEEYYRWLGWGKRDDFEGSALAANAAAEVLMSC